MRGSVRGPPSCSRTRARSTGALHAASGRPCLDCGDCASGPLRLSGASRLDGFEQGSMQLDQLIIARVLPRPGRQIGLQQHRPHPVDADPQAVPRRLGDGEMERQVCPCERLRVAVRCRPAPVPRARSGDWQYPVSAARRAAARATAGSTADRNSLASAAAGPPTGRPERPQPRSSGSTTNVPTPGRTSSSPSPLSLETASRMTETLTATSAASSAQ